MFANHVHRFGRLIGKNLGHITGEATDAARCPRDARSRPRAWGDSGGGSAILAAFLSIAVNLSWRWMNLSMLLRADHWLRRRQPVVGHCNEEYSSVHDDHQRWHSLCL
jgi:hypothetical protein